MGIDDTLGLTCGAGCVTHAGSVVFIEISILGTGAVLLQQFLVVFVSGRRGLTAERDHDDALKTSLVLDLVVNRQQHIVYDQEPIFCMVHNVRQFIRVQAKI